MNDYEILAELKKQTKIMEEIARDCKAIKTDMSVWAFFIVTTITAGLFVVVGAI